MSYVICPLELHRHRDGLRLLWRESGFGDPDASAFMTAGFAWLYEVNQPSMMRTWVVETADAPGRAIGCATAVRGDRVVDGVMVDAGFVTAMAIAPRHRTLAASVVLQRSLLAQSQEIPLNVLVGGPTQRAMATCARAGYTTLGSARTWVKDLRAISVAPIGSPSESIEVVARADARFDRAWHRASERHVLLADKRAQYLNWRGAQLSQIGLQYFCLVSRGGDDVHAFVGFYPDNTGVYVTDLFVDVPGRDAIERLMHHFVQWSLAQGHSWVGLSFFGASYATRVLEDLGFVCKGEPQPVVGYFRAGTSPSHQRILLDVNHWLACASELHS